MRSMESVARTVVALAIAIAVGGAPGTAQESVTIRSSEVAGMSVHFLNIPWGPQTFSAMEQPTGGFYSDRTWPFARLESSVGFKMGDTEIAAGNYALVFHPNSGEGMSIEVVRIEAGEFLESGNIMTKTPEGESLHKQPAIFEKVEDTVASLSVALEASEGSVEIHVRYGDRRLVKTLKLS